VLETGGNQLAMKSPDMTISAGSLVVKLLAM
jgi:hypothetical protein